MSLFFICLFVFNFLQIFVFLTVWCYFLLVIFRLIVFLVLKRYPQHGQLVAVCVSLLVSSSLLFELLHLYMNIDSFERSGSCPLWNTFFYTSCDRRNINWFGPIWRLNPVYVMAHLVEKIIVTVSRLCGRLVAGYIAAVFDDQPWMVGFVSLLMTFLVIVVVICLRILLTPFSTLWDRSIKAGDR